MSRNVRCSLIQATNAAPPTASLEETKKAMVDKHIGHMHAVANGYFIGAINRVGVEAPWNVGEFYGSSYFCDPRGRIIAQPFRDQDEILTTDLNRDMIGEVRKTWQFFRDRRLDRNGPLVQS
jgi:predicted amidohydrolase